MDLSHYDSNLFIVNDLDMPDRASRELETPTLSLPELIAWVDARLSDDVHDEREAA